MKWAAFSVCWNTRMMVNHWMTSHTVTDNLLRWNAICNWKYKERVFKWPVVWGSMIPSNRPQPIPDMIERTKKGFEYFKTRMSQMWQRFYNPNIWGLISSSALHGLCSETASKINKWIRKKGGLPKKRIQGTLVARNFLVPEDFYLGSFLVVTALPLVPKLYGPR